MLFLLWLVPCVVAVSLIFLFPALWRRDMFRKYSGWRQVTCPENHEPATVNMDGRHAAATGLHGLPDVRLCDCTRWPERAQCAQPCLAQAVQAKPYPGEVKVGTKPIHHLPVVLAAFAAWVLGAVWHSQFVFRTRWTHAIGLTYAQVREIRWWYSPHVLTVAVCLLFAYGVAWLLAVSHRKGVLPGVLMAVMLSAAVAAASGYGLARLPHDLLLMEAGYVVLAALTVGAIVGGLQDKLVLRPQ